MYCPFKNNIFLSTSLVVLFIATGCASRQEEKESAIRFLVTSPLQKDTALTRQYVCQIRSIQHIELRALERGYLQEIFVDEGQTVRAGQRMFQIMPLLYQAELKKAEADASFAEIEYNNIKSLADNKVVSDNELALTKAKFDKAKAELALAKTHLLFTEIKAPFSGMMDRFYARKGSLLQEGDLLTILSDNSKIWVYFNVPEAEYLNYRSNENDDSYKHVKLLMANRKIFEHPGIVETIEADFNNQTGIIPFRATFPNPNAILRHGETGSILVTIPLNGALIIPQKATFEILDKKYVFVVNKEDVIEQREITLSAEMPDIYVVKSGLKADEKILLEGLRKVSVNDKIEYEYQDPKEVVAHLQVYAE
jgi:membrane fusion protein (multidrug efflux system)